MRILIVEDEAGLREQLQSRLRGEGYAVDAAATGNEGLYLGLEYDIDLAIIDLGLPGMSGIEIIKQLRAAGRDYPIMILTARGRWQDKVEGLEVGADDYMVKPFHIEELLARVRVLIRRSSGITQPVLSFGPIELDTTTQTVRAQGEAVDLTAFEYKVLEYLIFNAGKVVSKSELTEHIYEQDYDRDSNVIEVFIRRLRKKLDPDNTLNVIETLRGRGYRFTLDAHKPQ